MLEEYESQFLVAVKLSKGSDIRLCMSLISDYLNRPPNEQIAIASVVMHASLGAAIELAGIASRKSSPNPQERMQLLNAYAVLAQISEKIIVPMRLVDDSLTDFVGNKPIGHSGALLLYSILAHRSLWRGRLPVLSQLVRRSCLEIDIPVPKRSRRSDLLTATASVCNRYSGKHRDRWPKVVSQTKSRSADFLQEHD